MKIPTPIPKPLADAAKRIFRGGLGIVLYRLVVLVVLGSILVGIILGGPGAVVGFAIVTILAAWLLEDILATINAIWNANFHTVKL